MNNKSTFEFEPGTTVILDRDWASYSKGTRFVVVECVPCGEIGQADGSTITPVNVRVVLEGEAVPANPVQARTIPAEYAVQAYRVNQAVTVDANQGVRDGTVLAALGTQALVEYEMPGGRTYGRIIDVLKPDWYRAVCLTNLPAKWKAELAR